MASRPLPNGSDSLRFAPVQSSLALGQSLRTFTRTMRNSVFLYFMLLTTVCTLDFLSDVVPAALVCMSFGAVFASIYHLQSIQAQFLRMRSVDTPAQLAAASTEHRQSISRSVASVLYFFCRRCWCRRHQQRHTTPDYHQRAIAPAALVPSSSIGNPLSAVTNATTLPKIREEEERFEERLETESRGKR